MKEDKKKKSLEEDTQDTKPVPGSTTVGKKGLSLSDETWVEITRASKSLDEMERKIAKLNSVAQQGAGKQKGFLSPSQVKMVMEMLDEIEDAYEKHYQSLEHLQEEYNKKSQKMHEEVMKSQELLTYAEGGADGMGDRLPEQEVDRRRERRDTLIEEMERFKKDSQPELDAIKQSIEKLEYSKGMSESVYNEDIGKLHEYSPYQNHMENAAYSTVRASGMIMSMGSLLGYMSKGYGNLTEKQWGASDLGQKLDFYEGDDKQLRKDLTKLGRETDYDTSSTIQTGRILARGGVENKEGFEKDIKTSQEMGRAFSIDPNQMADMGTLMKQVNALEDGQMQRLANLIGNSVNKSGMKGREEEQVRSTQKILESVTSNLNEVDFSQVQGVIGLQDLLAEASPKLKGEGGAQAIQNMDSAIKNGNNVMDIMLGYGTDPRYQGIEGRAQLEYDKEKGASDPENLKRILQNADRFSDNDSYKALMLKSLGFADLHDIEALNNSGALQKIKNGEILNEDIIDQMDKEGSDTVKKSLAEYNKSMSHKTRGNKVDKENLGMDMAEPVQGVWENAKGMFYSQPEVLQATELFGAGVLGAPLLRKGVKKASGKIMEHMPNILGKYGSRGGGGTPPTGGGGGIDDFISATKDTAGSLKDDAIKGSTEMMSKVKGFGKNAVNYSKEGAGMLGETLEGASKGIASSLDDVGKGALSGVGKTVGKLGAKAIPIAGMALDTGINMAEGDSLGKSVTKAGLAGALALGAGALLAPVTGGLSLGAGLAVAGGVGLGSSMISDKVVDSVWKEDKKKEKLEDESPVEKTRKVESSSKYKEMNSKLEGELESVEGNYNINVHVSGSIDGMTPTNQTEVTNSVSDFFSNLLNGGRRSQGINLSRGWNRG